MELAKQTPDHFDHKEPGNEVRNNIELSSWQRNVFSNLSDDIRDEFQLTPKNSIFVESEGFYENGWISIQDASYSPIEASDWQPGFEKNDRSGFNVVLSVDGIKKEASQVPLADVEFAIQVLLGRKGWDEYPAPKD